MDWSDLIEARHTTYAWEDTVPDKNLILDALYEVHQHIPSKNLMFPYQVRLMRNDDPKIRKEIFTICHRNEEMDKEVDHGNPQVLAPWLLGFNARWTADLETRHEKTSSRGQLNGLGKGQRRTNEHNGGQTQSENIEIGIFSAYIMLSLANRGLSTGMCQNICKNYTRAEEIFKLSEDERALDFRFIMGIGYAKDIQTRHQYFDPRIDAYKNIPVAPVNVEIPYPRPNFDDVIKVIKE
tara:strand:+ start:136 stop:849 length:714 start_codon:yes stop_codon:yes gene_type:complete